MDFPEWLVFPLFAGVAAFFVIRKRLDRSFYTNENIVLFSIVIGVFISLPFYFLKELISNFTCFHAPSFLSDEFINVLNSALILLWGAFVAYAYLTSEVINKWWSEQETVNSALEEIAVRAIRSHAEKIDNDTDCNSSLVSHMIELSNGKIYVGVITFIDLSNDNGYLSFLPLKSASRQSDGSVGEYLNYLSQEVLEIDVLRPDIIVPKKEIVTLREFHPELHLHFTK